MQNLSVEKALAATCAPFEAKHRTLGQPGMLETMSWAGYRLAPLVPGDVQVRILYVGLNFHEELYIAHLSFQEEHPLCLSW